MYTVTVNNNQILRTNLSIENNRFKGSLNDVQIEGDFVRISPWEFHIISSHRSYYIEVIKLNREEKALTLKINSSKHTIQLKDKYDELLHTLGLDKLAAKKVNDIKAPMPGMVLKVLVNEGDSVKKGDALIVLEAMKMENILKSPSDGEIRKIHAVKGTAVEKNQLLIQF